MNEIQNPCANCDFRGEDKNKGKCRKCIESGKPLKYCVEMGSLAESLPIDIELIGNGGLKPIKQKKGFEIPSDIKPIISKICQKYNLAIKNMIEGFEGNTYRRARFDIIKHFISSGSDLNSMELSIIIGISSDRIDLIIDQIENIDTKIDEYFRQI